MDLSAVEIYGDGAELRISVNGQRPSAESTEFEPGVIGFEFKPGAKAGAKPGQIRYVEGSSVLQPLRLLENVEYDFTLRLKADAERLAQSEHALAPFRMDSLAGVASLNSPDSWRTEGEWLIVTGRMNFKNRAGRANLSIGLDSASLELFADVAPAKIDYEEHFHSIVDALAKRHVELLLRLDTGVETSLELLEDEPSSPLEEMIHLRRFFESGVIEQAIRLIESNPTRTVKAEQLMEPTALCADPDWSRFLSAPYESEWIQAGGDGGFYGGWMPQNLPTARKHISTESKENRYVKHLLLVLVNRMDSLAAAIPRSQKASHFALRRWQNTLQHVLENPFWFNIEPRGVMPNSMALLQRAGYRDIVRSMAEFAMAVALMKDHAMSEVGGELKPVYDLYETWCFFAFCDAASRVAGEDLSGQIQLSRDPESPLSVLGTIKHAPLKATFNRAGAVIQMTVHYNRTFKRTGAEGWQDSYSVQLRPDISVLFETGSTSHWIHFDAKYRLDTKQVEDAWATVLDDDADADSYVDDDIHVMHTYRDALLGTRGSFVLYPGRETKAKLFTRHGESAYRTGEKLPSVGAFPFLPTDQGTAAQELELSDFLEMVATRVASAAGYQEEAGFI